MLMRSLLSLSCLFVFAASQASAEGKPVKPGNKDKCPVCGMFVSKFPDWSAQVLFKDGAYAVFDGPKDMFRYYVSMKKYNPSKTLKDIDSIYVTEYYGLTLIDGRKAYYVLGSDVYGPMGRELVPFLKEEEASSFMKDHKGKVLRFGDVTEKMLKGLE